jgi:hypothetical protein
MKQTINTAGHKKMWAYGYAITPPQSEERLAAVQALLDSEHTDAKSHAHTWEGRFVHEESVTHILVVADSPDQHQAVNQKLEAALTAIDAGYSLTAPLAVEEERPTGIRPPTDIE